MVSKNNIHFPHMFYQCFTPVTVVLSVTDILPAGCLKDLLSWQIGNMDTQDEPFDHLVSCINGASESQW